MSKWSANSELTTHGMLVLGTALFWNMLGITGGCRKPRKKDEDRQRFIDFYEHTETAYKW